MGRCSSTTWSLQRFASVPVLRETDEVLDVASEALQDVILEGSAQVRSALNVVGMGVQIVAVWFVSTMMMNLWQRCRNGNTAEYGARLRDLTDGGSVQVQARSFPPSQPKEGACRSGSFAVLQGQRLRPTPSTLLAM